MSKFSLYNDDRIEAQQGAVSGSIRTLIDFKIACANCSQSDEIWFADACGENALAAEWNRRPTTAGEGLEFYLQRHKREGSSRLTVMHVLSIGHADDFAIRIFDDGKKHLWFDYIYLKSGYLGQRLVLSSQLH